MELHNTVEEIILSKVEDIFSTIEKEGNPENFCTCSQCRIDTACYVLNRTPPHYIVSNRGAARVQQVTIERQQREADITALIYEGLKRVSHNQRPNFQHAPASGEGLKNPNNPVFNIPTIVGRLFDGNNFAPLSNVRVELRHKGDLVAMKDANWQNPYNLVANTAGTFTFWPVSIPAESANDHKVFEFAVRVEASQFETLTHFFKVPVISEFQTANTFTLGRTLKLPDLYMFPPGEAEKNGYLD
jgi:competence protein ComFB